MVNRQFNLSLLVKTEKRQTYKSCMTDIVSVILVYAHLTTTGLRVLSIIIIYMIYTVHSDNSTHSYALPKKRLYSDSQRATLVF